MRSRFTVFAFMTGFLVMFNAIAVLSQVVPSASNTDKYFRILHGKKVGVVANNASMVGKMNIVDTMIVSGIDVRVVFSPEHGFRITEEAGAEVSDFRDPVTNVRVVSLYGLKKKPVGIDLEGLDLVVFDLQDVGTRFFTYISTLSLVMEACAENNIAMLVLDRPNPNAFYIDGPVLDMKFKSFVGMHTVPVVYGMTIGEYARMINGEGWLGKDLHCNLTVLPMENYTHQDVYFPLEKPSPNLTSSNAILLYPSLCFFEGTTVSVGRGTLFPFEVYGHPDLEGKSFSFKPGPIPGMDSHPQYNGKYCFGEDLRNYFEKHPDAKGKIMLSWLIDAYRDLGQKPGFFTEYFDRLAGNDELRKQIIQGMNEEEIRKSWQPGIEDFKKIRERYLLYP